MSKLLGVILIVVYVVVSVAGAKLVGHPFYPECKQEFQKLVRGREESYKRLRRGLLYWVPFFISLSLFVAMLFGV